MKTLSVAACSAWLAEHGISEDPYGSLQSDQFPLPPEASRSSSLIREFVAASAPFDWALIRFTDWPLYQPDEMAVVAALRSSFGDRGLLIDTPGHIFSSEEVDLVAGVFSLAASYHWSAYLYFDHRSVFHCWEGDLLDLWIPDWDRLGVVRSVFAAHSLSSNQSGDGSVN